MTETTSTPARSSGTTPRARLIWAAPPLLYIPAIYAASRALDVSPGESLQSLGTTAVLATTFWVFIAAIRPHFDPRHAAIAALAAFAFDEMNLRDWIVTNTSWLIDYGGNPNWVIVALMLGASTSVAITCAFKTTLYRLVLLVMLCAQTVTMAGFHTLLITRPMHAHSTNERIEIHNLHQADKIDMLCDVNGRTCYQGHPEDLASAISTDVDLPDAIVSILRDTRLHPHLLHIWTESSFTKDSNNTLRHITVAKSSADQATVMINGQAPTAQFTTMRFGFNALALLFQQIWVTLTVSILWKHRDYIRKKRRWKAA